MKHISKFRTSALRFLAAICLSMCTVSCASVGGLPGPVPKQVSQKIPSNRLVARDGTWCTVNARTFEETDVGDTVVCIWRASERIPGQH